ncbi:hypothetical protein J1N35_001647 [Gossypium stocksii]|uniref:Uncharacterized protein n=1 Tax=Gossypium stocksii TaxID=47602 RepID=A0A9D3WJE1_9ROSI|nr:hypothetical protein J1N35_001647 [Gossypium stocksii]
MTSKSTPRWPPVISGLYGRPSSVFKYWLVSAPFVSHPRFENGVLQLRNEIIHGRPLLSAEM